MPVVSLLEDMPRGEPGRGKDRSDPPSAEFLNPATLSEPEFAYGSRGGIFSARRPAETLFLGVIDGEVQGPKRARFVTGGRAVGWLDDRHMCTIAGSRAGKGRAVIVPNMLRYPGSVLAVDPKGELATLTARPRQMRLGQKVYVLDPFGEAKGHAQAIARNVGFNPIAAMHEDRRIEGAALIADALVPVSDKDPHWDESARTLIEGVILHVATSADYDGRRSLATVHELIGLGIPGAKNPMNALAAKMAENKAEGLAIPMAAASFTDKPDNERGSVLSTARRHLRFLGFEGIARVTTAHSFDLAALKTDAITVYACLPARHMGTCARWLRLFVNLTLQAMEETKAPLATGLPVLMALDEFAILGHLRQLEEAAGQIAGFGCKLWPILQDLGQLKALYKDRWETFLGNAGVLQFFGNNDLTTLEWISKRCGKATIRVRNDIARTEGAKQAGATAQSWSTEVYDLLSVDEIARKFAREDHLLRQLVIIGGGRPVVLQRAFYDQHELFKGMVEG